MLVAAAMPPAHKSADAPADASAAADRGESGRPAERDAVASPPPSPPERDEEAAPPADGEAGQEEEEEETCGFCRFMKGGGCRDVFIVRTRPPQAATAQGCLATRGRTPRQHRSLSAPHALAHLDFRLGRSAWTRTANRAPTLWTPARA